MSEYMEKHAVSRMIGSPQAMWDMKRAGNLLKPSGESRMLLSCLTKLRKLIPDVSQILLQILEDGRLTDSLGRKVDF